MSENAGSMTIGDGYTCPSCQSFVFWNQIHTCQGRAPWSAPFQVQVPPAVLPFPGQTVVVHSLTEADMRRIVREELERMFDEHFPKQR